MNGDRRPERFDTVIVGGGQGGLGAGYNLARLGQSFVILDGHQRIGDTWRERWDSLRVFTPAKYNGLPGMRFPSPRLSFPTKDEVADYLDAYAARFELPVITGVRVDRITKNSAGFVLSADHRTFEASNVVVATGACHNPKVPSFSAELDPKVTQIHSSVYKSPAQLKEGAVLVVGLGNSGAEISFELARTHRTFVSGRPTGEIPAPHGPGAAIFLLPLIKFMGSHVLNMDTPIGRKAEPQFIRHGAPLIRRKLKDLASAGSGKPPPRSGARNS